MYQAHHTNYPYLAKLNPSDSENSLGFGKITFKGDPAKRQLILNIETHRMISHEVKADLKGHRLIFEAPLIISYNKPFNLRFFGFYYFLYFKKIRKANLF